MGMRITLRFILRKHGDHLIVRVPEGQSTYVVESLQTRVLEAFKKVAGSRDPRRSIGVDIRSELGTTKTMRVGSQITLSVDGKPFWQDQIMAVDPTFVSP